MYWLLAAAIFLIIFPFLFTFILFRAFMCKPKKAHNPMPKFDPFTLYKDQIDEGKRWFWAHNPEPVSIQSYDGLTLRGHVIAHPDARGTIVFMHGYHGTGLRDFSCALRTFYDRGLNLVVPDQRASGASEGKFITFGTRERYDCRDWLLFANRRFGEDKPLLMDGVSMGAATVMLACGLELPKNVIGAIADSGYTSPYDIVACVMQNGLKLPRWPFLPITEWLARVWAKFSLHEANCKKAVSHAKIPILFAHGEADDFVPTRMGLECYEACASEKCLLTVPGAGHGMSFLIEKERYEKLLEEFHFSRL